MEPEIVKATTDDYRASQDWMSRFLEEKAEPMADGCVGAREMYDAYVSWCKDTGEFQLREAKFAEGMKSRGHESTRFRHAGKVGRWYKGFRLRSRLEGFTPAVLDASDAY